MAFTRIGITAPRDGLSPHQIQALTSALMLAVTDGATHFHHGDCVGGDAEGARVAKALGMRLVCHPPTNPKLRAYVPSDETRPAKGYLERDRELVNELAVGNGALLGFPRLPEVPRGSGTWYTVHYARHKQVPLLCVTPDGMVIDHYKAESLSPFPAKTALTTESRIGVQG